jgi:hypothetical protein
VKYHVLSFYIIFFQKNIKKEKLQNKLQKNKDKNKNNDINCPSVE